MEMVKTPMFYVKIRNHPIDSVAIYKWLALGFFTGIDPTWKPRRVGEVGFYVMKTSKRKRLWQNLGNILLDKVIPLYVSGNKKMANPSFGNIARLWRETQILTTYSAICCNRFGSKNGCSKIPRSILETTDFDKKLVVETSFRQIFDPDVHGGVANENGTWSSKLSSRWPAISSWRTKWDTSHSISSRRLSHGESTSFEVQ